MIRSKLLICLVIIVTLIVTTSCTNSKSNKVANQKPEVNLSMTVWGGTDQLKSLQQVVKGYRVKNPNVTVTFSMVAADYDAKLQEQLASEQAPDLFIATADQLPSYIEAGEVADLTKFLTSKKSKIKKDQVMSGLWGAARARDGKIFAVPIESNPTVIFYNKAMFKEIGMPLPQESFENRKWNWQTFDKLTQSFSQVAKYGFILENDWATTSSWVWANGGNMFDANGQYMFPKNNEAQDTIRYLNHLMHNGGVFYKGIIPPDLTKEILFMTQQVAMIEADVAAVSLFEKNVGLKFDIISVPTNTKNQTEPVGIYTNYIAMNEKTKQRDEALKFLEYFSSAEGQKLRNSPKVFSIPTVSKADSVLSSLKKIEHTEHFTNARDLGIALGTTRAAFNATPMLKTSIENILHLMYTSAITDEDAIEQLKQLGSQ